MSGRGCTFCLIAVLAAIVTVSCSLKSEGSAFTSKLDEIDDFIAQGQTDDAIAALKKAEKNAYSSFACIGIYRRYMQLGETGAAEKILIKALKKNRQNPELTAVYTHFLLRSDRLADAAKIAGILAGTQYESILTEVQLRQALAAGSGKKEFFTVKYIPLYLAAYKTSLNTMWLRNSAVLHMMNGAFNDAADLKPEMPPSAQDAYFWALILYDSGKVSAAADCLDLAEKLAAGGTDSTKDVMIQAALLRSDLYIHVGDQESAEAERQKVFSLGGSLPSLYVNSAYWAEKNGNTAERYRLLNYAVHAWPDYVPGLAAYGRFAYESSKPFADDEYTRTIRAAGLKTIDMQQYDDMPRVPVSDALSRMEGSLSRKKDPLLYITKLSLEYRTHPEIDQKTQLAALWQILEENQSGKDVYPKTLVHYAVHLLLITGQKQDAASLFEKYIRSSYGFNTKENFWDQTVAAASRLSMWEAEYAAWFAADLKNRAAALRLYEFAVYESGRNSDSEISPFVSSESAANLAMLYDSTGDKQKALKLYSLTAGLTADMKVKSEILYRMGCIQKETGDTASAQRSFEYAVSLDPSNENARLKLHEMKD